MTLEESKAELPAPEQEAQSASRGPLSEEESLQRMGRDHGPEFEAEARHVAAELQQVGRPYNPLYVLVQTKLRLQAERLLELDMLYYTPFNSDRL